MASELYSIGGIENEIRRIKQSFDDQMLDFNTNEVKQKCFRELKDYSEIRKLKRRKTQFITRYYLQALQHKVLISWSLYIFSSNHRRHRLNTLNHRLLRRVYRKLIQFSKYKKFMNNKHMQTKSNIISSWNKVTQLSKAYKFSYTYRRHSLLKKVLTGLYFTFQTNLIIYKEISTAHNITEKDIWMHRWKLVYMEKVKVRKFRSGAWRYNKESLRLILKRWKDIVENSKTINMNICVNMKCIITKIKLGLRLYKIFKAWKQLV